MDESEKADLMTTISDAATTLIEEGGYSVEDITNMIENLV